MFLKNISYTVITLLIYIHIGSGQILGPAMPVKTFEVGCIQKIFYRSMLDQDYDWKIFSLFMKYGICRSITISAESFVHARFDAKFPDRDYYRYTFGAGITAGGVNFISLSPILSFHYYERLSFDRSEYRYHKNSRGIVGAVQLEREFKIVKQNIKIWLGPAYIYDVIYQYPPNGSVYLCKSKNNFGFICGTNILLLKHLDCFAHLVYANHWQPRYGLGLRF